MVEIIILLYQNIIRKRSFYMFSNQINDSNEATSLTYKMPIINYLIVLF